MCNCESIENIKFVETTCRFKKLSLAVSKEIKKSKDELQVKYFFFSVLSFHPLSLSPSPFVPVYIFTSSSHFPFSLPFLSV